MRRHDTLTGTRQPLSSGLDRDVKISLLLREDEVADVRGSRRERQDVSGPRLIDRLLKIAASGDNNRVGAGTKRRPCAERDADKKHTHPCMRTEEFRPRVAPPTQAR